MPKAARKGLFTHGTSKEIALHLHTHGREMQMFRRSIFSCRICKDALNAKEMIMHSGKGRSSNFDHAAHSACVAAFLPVKLKDKENVGFKSAETKAAEPAHETDMSMREFSTEMSQWVYEINTEISGLKSEFNVFDDKTNAPFSWLRSINGWLAKIYGCLNDDLVVSETTNSLLESLLTCWVNAYPITREISTGELSMEDVSSQCKNLLNQYTDRNQRTKIRLTFCEVLKNAFNAGKVSELSVTDRSAFINTFKKRVEALNLSNGNGN